MPNQANSRVYLYLSLLLSSLYLSLIVFWVYINFILKSTDSVSNYLFGLFLAFVPLMGFFGGIYSSKGWGFLTSKIGRALFFISLGLLFWSLGTFIFAYYNLVLNIEVPYPSIADVFYVLLYVFYSVGIFFLMYSTGAFKSLKQSHGKFLVAFVPFAVFLFSGYFLLDITSIFSVNILTFEFMLDIFYPLGDSLLLTFTLLILFLSARYLGGKYKFPIYILLLGFVIEYLADLLFSIKTADGTFYVGGFTDLLFLTSTFLVSLSLILFDSKRVLNKEI